MHKQSTFSDMEFSREITASTMHLHVMSDDHFCAVFEIGGQIQGGIAGALKPTFFGGDKVAQDTWVFVNPFMRKYGIADSLISAFSAWAKSNGAKRCYIGSLAGTDTNPNALKGFECAGNVIMRKF